MTNAEKKHAEKKKRRVGPQGPKLSAGGQRGRRAAGKGEIILRPP